LRVAKKAIEPGAVGSRSLRNGDLGDAQPLVCHCDPRRVVVGNGFGATIIIRGIRLSCPSRTPTHPCSEGPFYARELLAKSVQGLPVNLLCRPRWTSLDRRGFSGPPPLPPKPQHALPQINIGRFRRLHFRDLRVVLHGHCGAVAQPVGRIRIMVRRCGSRQVNEPS